MFSDLRRTALLAIVLLGLGGAAFALIRSEQGKAAHLERAASAPNVLLIISDDQRYGTMRTMPKTRRFFGAGGRFYPNAIDSSPLCCPSRAQIFSGQYAHNTRVTSNSQALRLNQDHTLQALLQRAGYRTGLYGKFLNLWPGGKPAPHFNGSVVGFGPNKGIGRISQHAEEWLAGRASFFLDHAESNDSQPWYLVLATHAPHGPHIPAARFAHAGVGRCHLSPAQRETDLSDKSPFVRSTAVHFRKHQLKGPCKIRQLQLRQQLSIDRMVGAVSNSLRKYGESKNTLAIYISDNGYLWGDHGLFEKFAPYTADLKVPMYVRWPGHIRAGSVDHRLADNVDLAPTIYRAAGITPDYPLDGHSLLEKRQHGWLLSELGNTGSGIPAYAALLSKRWHYIEYLRHFASRRSVSVELYDLRRDPAELKSLVPGGRLNRASKAVRRRVSKLHALLVHLRACDGAACDT